MSSKKPKGGTTSNIVTPRDNQARSEKVGPREVPEKASTDAGSAA